MLIMKFGGTSVAGADAIANVVNIIKQVRQEHPRLGIVVSAMGHTTDKLLEIARSAVDGTMAPWHEAITELAVYHRETAAELVKKWQNDHDLTSRAGSTIMRLDNLIDELTALCRSIEVLSELTPRTLDRIAGIGERMSAPLVALGLRCVGIPAQAVDASAGVLITNDRFGEASPDLIATRKAVRDSLVPLMDAGTIPVLTGYVGATQEGLLTTLGRGGSDYSAALFGAALDVDEVWVWSDVDGILTADPKVVPDARFFESLSYATAAEMALCGADVLHPKTIQPLVGANIPLRIKNTFNPDHPGTIIATGIESDHAAAIISAVDLCQVTVRAETGNWSSDLVATCLGNLAQAGIAVLLFLQSAWQQSVSILVRKADAVTAFRALAMEGVTVETRSGVSTVSVIGPNVIGPTLAALGETGTEVLAVSQATPGAGVILVVPEEEMPPLVRHLHDRVTNQNEAN